MTQIARTTLLLLLALVLAACGSSGNGVDEDDDTPPTEDPTPIAGNNAGVLRNLLTGDGSASTTALRTEVPVTVVDPHPSLDVDDTATITRRTTTVEGTYAIVPVTNTGATTLCFVQAQGWTYGRLTSGPYDVGDTFVTGSVGRTDGGTYTDTCLAAGETGHLLTIDTPDAGEGLWTEIEDVRIAGFDAEAVDDGGHGGSLVPTDGAVVMDGTTERLEIEGTNEGALTLEPGAFSTYVLLDASDEPVLWGFLDEPTFDLAPEAAATWTSTVAYAGSSNAVRVRFDFEPVSAPSARAALCERDADTLTQEERLEARTRTVEALRDGTRGTATRLCAD